MAGRGAWDHQLLRLEAPIPERKLSDFAGGCFDGGCKRCKRGKRRPAEWALTYRYVTGRKGRVTEARTLLCTDHAARAAARAGLPSPYVDTVATIGVVFEEARDVEDPARRLRVILDSIRNRPELFEVCLVCRKQRKLCTCEVDHAES